MCGAGAFLIGLAIRNARTGSASRRWPQVEGRVLRSFVLVQEDADGVRGSTPQVEYEYVVEGTTFRGMRLRYGQTGSWSRGQAERVIAPYPAGARVRVFFDPRKPGDAVLIRGVFWGNVAIALAGVSFVVAAYLIQRGK
jgi:uncharacterized protein DUF3592